jgi:hypothetical protein
MKTYSLVYSERSKQLLALATVIFILSGFYLILARNSSFERIPSWVAPGVFITLLIVSLVMVMNKVVKLPAEVAVGEDALYIRLHRTNQLYRKDEIFIPLHNVSRFTQDINTQNDYKKYCSLTTKEPSKTILILQSIMVDDKMMEEFLDRVKVNIDRYNRTKPAEEQIVRGSFYDALWAQGLTYVVYLALSIITLAAITVDVLPWYKLMQVYVVAAAWLLAYHTNRTKKFVKRNTSPRSRKLFKG